MATMQTSFNTRMDIDEDTRADMIAVLNQALADLSDLRSQTKQAHWNVRGPHFIAYHDLFDKLVADLDAPVDDLAERIGALGGRAEGTIRMAAGKSRLVDLPLETVRDEEVVAALADRFSYVAAWCREAIDKAADASDDVTADLFTEVTRGLDQSLWFLEAHVQ